MGSEICVFNYFVPDLTLTEVESKNKQFDEAEHDVREQIVALLFANPKDNVVTDGTDVTPKFASDATRKRLKELNTELRKIIEDRFLVREVFEYQRDKDIWVKDYGDIKEENGGVVLPMFYMCERFDPAEADAEAFHKEEILKRMFAQMLKISIGAKKPDADEVVGFVDDYVGELYVLTFTHLVEAAHKKDPKSVEWSW